MGSGGESGGIREVSGVPPGICEPGGVIPGIRGTGAPPGGIRGPGAPSTGAREGGTVAVGGSGEVRGPVAGSLVPPGSRSVKPGGLGPGGRVAGPRGRSGGGSPGARCDANGVERGSCTACAAGAVSMTSGEAPGPAPSGDPPAPDRGAGIASSVSSRAADRPSTASAAEAKRWSRESGVGAGPVSSVESSYS
ncbi:hypothetical protein SALBM311S_07017 [Streptomyces alboniger]